MQLFSEDYLMHYGVKGMKWKKRKAGDLRETDTGSGERVTDIQKAVDAHRARLDSSNPDYRWYRSAALSTGDHMEYQKRENREIAYSYPKIEAREAEKRKKLRANAAQREKISMNQNQNRQKKNKLVREKVNLAIRQRGSGRRSKNKIGG